MTNRVVVSGIGMGESLRWHDGALWFADWRTGGILRVDADGATHEVARVPSFPTTFDWLPDGRLVAVSGAAAKLLVADAGGGLGPLLDLAAITPTPWNEVIADAAGRLYLNGIGYPYGQQAEAVGSVVLVEADGSHRTVADGLAFPNGMAITADGGTLVVAESNAGRLAAFTIEADGGLTSRAPWAELDGSAPDGICLDPGGAIWFADVPNRSCTLVADGGEVLRVVEYDDGAFSCVTDPDGGLYAVTAPWPGAIQDPTAHDGRIWVTPRA